MPKVDAGGRTTGASDAIPNAFLGVSTITNPQPDRTYSRRVEARTTLQDTDRRGRSDTIQFTTRSW